MPSVVVTLLLMSGHWEVSTSQVRARAVSWPLSDSFSMLSVKRHCRLLLGGRPITRLPGGEGVSE